MVLNRTWSKFTKLHRIMCLALCLGVVCFAIAGTAWATGTTRLATGATPSTYATEITLNPSVGGTTYKLVNGLGYNSDLYRVMQVARTTAQNFTVRVELGNGAKFATGVLPVGGDVTVDSVSGGGAGAATFSVAAGGANGDSYVLFLSNITTTFTGFPTLKIASGANGWTIKDVANQLATGPITVSVRTYDAADGTEVDGGGTNDCNIAASTYALQIPVGQTLVSTTAVVDVATNRQLFVATAPDTTTVDNGATIGVGYVATLPLSHTGAAFALAAADRVRFTFTSSNDFTGFTYVAPNTTGIQWAGFNATTVGTTRTVNVVGTDASIGGGALPFTFTVDGLTQLPTRTLQVKVDVVFFNGGSTPGNPGVNGVARSLQTYQNVTVWSFNGSVLVANWLNGNTNQFSSRVYIWNPSSLAGAVTVRLFTEEPVTGGPVTSTEITVPGSPLSLGTLSGSTGMNIKLKEDILDPLVTAGRIAALPYTTNGGNLVLEITIRSSGVRGSYQVFTSAGGAAFGVSPLMIVQ